MRRQGTLGRFWGAKSYGFIYPVGESSGLGIYVHASQIKGVEQVQLGMRLEYTEGHDSRGRPLATNVTTPKPFLSVEDDLRSSIIEKKQKQKQGHPFGGSSHGAGSEQRLVDFVVTQLQANGSMVISKLAAPLYQLHPEVKAKVAAAGGLRQWLGSRLAGRVQFADHGSGLWTVQLSRAKDVGLSGQRSSAGPKRSQVEAAAPSQHSHPRGSSSDGDGSSAAKRARTEPPPSASATGRVQLGGGSTGVSGQDQQFGQNAIAKRLERFGGSAGSGSGKATARTEPPLQQAQQRSTAAAERRYDTDGAGGRQLYTKAEFIEEYGGTREWEQAAREQPQPQQNRGTDAKVWRQGGGSSNGDGSNTAGKRKRDEPASSGAARPMSKSEGKRRMPAEPTARAPRPVASADGTVVMEMTVEGAAIAENKALEVSRKSGCRLLQRSTLELRRSLARNKQGMPICGSNPGPKSSACATHSFGPHVGTGRGMLALEGHALQLRHAAQLLLGNAKGKKGGPPVLQLAADDDQADWLLGQAGGTLRQLKRGMPKKGSNPGRAGWRRYHSHAPAPVRRRPCGRANDGRPRRRGGGGPAHLAVVRWLRSRSGAALRKGAAPDPRGGARHRRAVAGPRGRAAEARAAQRGGRLKQRGCGRQLVIIGRLIRRRVELSGAAEAR